eukprot:66948-Prymnesium_polylepis.1
MLGGVGVGAAMRLLGMQQQAPSPQSTRESSTRWWSSKRLWARALPTLLFVLFCVTPSTSTNIFAAWSCDTFEANSLVEPATHVKFLRRDLSVICDGSNAEYSHIVSVAAVFVVVCEWFPVTPAGCQPLFVALLGELETCVRSQGPSARRPCFWRPCSVVDVSS